MSYVTSEAIQLVLRWLHVGAAMFWIGQAAFLARLGRRLETADVECWRHAGVAFEARSADRAGPDATPVRRAAALTWISGFLLLGLLYHHGGALLEPDSPIGHWAGIGISLGVLPLGWLVYDLLWSSPLGRRPLPTLAISVLLLGLGIFFLHRVFSPRAAYLHTGAVLATVMAANVWMRIVPAHRRLAAGTPRPEDRRHAEQRTEHNLHLAMPVVFTMISSHFPVTTYGHSLGWLVLCALVGVGLLTPRFHFRRSKPGDRSD